MSGAGAPGGWDVQERLAAVRGQAAERLQLPSAAGACPSCLLGSQHWGGAEACLPVHEDGHGHRWKMHNDDTRWLALKHRRSAAQRSSYLVMMQRV